MRWSALALLTILIAGCSTANSLLGGSPDLVPEPVAWTQTDQSQLLAARSKIKASEPLTDQDRAIINRALLEYSNLRIRNRNARAKID